MASARTRLLTVVGVVLGVLLTSTLVVRTTQAVFSGTTSSPTNSWATGGVAITNDSTASAVFSQSNDGTVTGGQVITRCVIVTYQGTNTPASVKLYGTASGALAGYLSLVIDQGAGTSGVAGSCAGFGASTSGIYSGTVAGFGSTATSFTSGVGSWSPASAGSTMTYRFTVTVQNVTAAQNVTASAVFTWEVQG